MRVSLLLIGSSVFTYILFYGTGMVPIFFISLVPLALGLLRLFDTREYRRYKERKKELK